MGTGIAYALLHAGARVTLIETDRDGVTRALNNLAQIIEASFTRGLITEAEAQDRQNRFTATTDYAQASDAMLAIEAAFESMEVKTQIFTRLEAVMPTDAILATNTSYLNIDEMAACVADPSRVVGLHFLPQPIL